MTKKANKKPRGVKNEKIQRGRLRGHCTLDEQNKSTALAKPAFILHRSGQLLRRLERSLYPLVSFIFVLPLTAES